MARPARVESLVWALARALRAPTLAVWALLAGCATVPAAAPPFRAPGTLAPFGATLAVLGDTQRTSWLEFWRESNDLERTVLLAAVADARPDLVLLTGDLVFDGSSPSDWQAFDEATEPLRRLDLPVVAARGNHEYWGSVPDGWKAWTARLPHLGTQRWYTLDVGALRLVVLDSNIDEMAEAEWATQLEWFREQLRRADADEAVRGVAVAMHHPPFTNSTVTGDEPHVQRDVVPAFEAAKKTCLLLSGHAHTYERFTRHDKLYVVSGGAGGPRVRLLEGSARRHPDDLVGGPSPRDFHFTLYSVTEQGLTARVVGMAKGATTARQLDTFTIAWAR